MFGNREPQRYGDRVMENMTYYKSLTLAGFMNYDPVGRFYIDTDKVYALQDTNELVVMENAYLEIGKPDDIRAYPLFLDHGELNIIVRSSDRFQKQYSRGRKKGKRIPWGDYGEALIVVRHIHYDLAPEE